MGEINYIYMVAAGIIIEVTFVGCAVYLTGVNEIYTVYNVIFTTASISISIEYSLEYTSVLASKEFRRTP